MLDGMSDSIQGSRIENLQSREVNRQSPTGLIFLVLVFISFVSNHLYFFYIITVFSSISIQFL